MKSILLTAALLLMPSTAIAQDTPLTPEQLYLIVIRDYDNSFIRTASDDALLEIGRGHCEEMRRVGLQQYSASIYDQIEVYERRVGGRELRDVYLPTLAVSQAALCPDVTGNN